MTKLSSLQADSGIPDISTKLPADFFVPTLTASIVDDDDNRADENETSEREKNENTEAAEELQHNDEDREGAAP